MNLRCTTTAAVVVALGAALPSLAAAQAGSGLTMPYQRNFWGHAGISVGGSRLDSSCPGGSSCDDSDRAWRIFGGGRFNDTFGGEIGYVDLGEYSRGGGNTDAKGLDFTLMAGVPFGNNWSVFGKLGAVYTRAKVDGTAAGLRTGTEHGWGPRYGLGLQMGLTQNWAARLDWDRYRVKLPGGRDDIDTLTLGAQYTFR